MRSPPIGRDCKSRPNKPMERDAFLRPIPGGPHIRKQALVFLENRDASASVHFMKRGGFRGPQLQPVCTPGPFKANNCSPKATRMLKKAGACMQFWNKPSTVWLDPWNVRYLSDFPRADALRVWLDFCCRIDSPDVKPLHTIRKLFLKYGKRLRVLDVNLSLRGVPRSEWQASLAKLQRVVASAAARCGLSCAPLSCDGGVYRARSGGVNMLRSCFDLHPANVAVIASATPVTSKCSMPPTWGQKAANFMKFYFKR